MVDRDKKGRFIKVCKNCHTKTNNNRKYWIKYFKQNEVENGVFSKF